MLLINLQSEYVLSVFGWYITNTFLTSLVTSVLLLFFAYQYFTRRKEKRSVGLLQRGWYLGVYKVLYMIDAVTGDRTLSKRLLPLVMTLFIFIFVSNLIALLPGFLGSFYVATQGGELSLLRSPNSDLTTTLALALVTVVAIQYFSIKLLGWRGYISRFLNFKGGVSFILGLFEGLSELLRVLSFSFRLFGNVFAGEVLLLVIAFLVPLALPVPFMVLEVFIGLIQAYIFAMLTLTYIKVSAHHATERG